VRRGKTHVSHNAALRRAAGWGEVESAAVRLLAVHGYRPVRLLKTQHPGYTRPVRASSSVGASPGVVGAAQRLALAKTHPEPRQVPKVGCVSVLGSVDDITHPGGVQQPGAIPAR